MLVPLFVVVHLAIGRKLRIARRAAAAAAPHPA
jgi:hypothetical protein